MTTIKTSPPLIDARVAASFEKRQHGPTVWLALQAPADADLTDVDEHLASSGWVRQPALCPPMVPLPAHLRQPSDPDYPTIDVHYHAAGTGLFGTHTAREAVAHKKAARTVLSRFGFARVPTNTLTLQDLL